MRSLFLAVVATGAVAAQSPLATRKIVEDLRIAPSADTPDFGSVRVGPHGEMVVFANEDQVLRFYSASGQRIGTFGRKGSGPGEFQNANRFGWVADTMWAYDPSLKRVTFISPSLKLVRTQPLPPSLSLSPSDVANKPGEGHIGIFSPQAIAGGKYVGVAVMYGCCRKDPGTPPKATAHRLYAVSPSGDGGVFLADVPSTSGPSVEYRGPTGYYSHVVPFTFPTLIEFSSDGTRLATLTNVSTATGGSYTLTMLSTRGDTLFRRTHPFVGERIPRRVVDSALSQTGISNGRRFYPPAVAAELEKLTRPVVPKFYPPFGSMILGIDGTTWLQSPPMLERTVIALDQRGTPLFAIKLPPRTRLGQASLTTLWTIQRDDDDVATMVRYRVLQPRARGTQPFSGDRLERQLGARAGAAGYR